MNRRLAGLGLCAGLAVIMAGASAPWAEARLLPMTESVTNPATVKLARSALATHQRSYRGTQVVAVYGGSPGATQALPGTTDQATEAYGGMAVTVFCDVTHVANVGTMLRLRETVQSPAQELFQRDVVATTSAGGRDDPGVGLSSASLALLRAHYVLTLTGTATEAGRLADVVTLDRPDGTIAGRFWLDRASALPLRREVYDNLGRLLRASAFLDLDVSNVSFQHKGVPELPPVSGVPVGRGALAGMRAAGWPVPEQVGGFDLFEARLTDADADPVLHLTYSDGLSSVSLFEQHGHLDASGLVGWQRQFRGGHPVWVRLGTPERVAWSGAGRVYTVVSDLPGGLVDGIVSTLPHDHGHGGLLHRLRRGADRVGSWLNPFS